jgi:hypothetical protein
MRKVDCNSSACRNDAGHCLKNGMNGIDTKCTDYIYPLILDSLDSHLSLLWRCTDLIRLLKMFIQNNAEVCTSVAMANL